MRAPLALLAALLSTTALAQTAPSPANMGITPTSPQSLQVLDSTKTWVTTGTVDPANHAFTGYGAGTDVRAFGCVADGATDQAACINAAIDAAPGCVIIPPTTNGFYVAPGSTINAKKCITGTFYNPVRSDGTLNAFVGQPWIKCGTSPTSVCIKTTYSGAYIARLNIAAAFPPAVGSIGLMVAGGNNSQIRDVNLSGFDQCGYWQSSGGNGLSSRAIGLNMSWCQSYFAVQDGWPELYFVDGRWGSNGGSPPNAMKAAVYITKIQAVGAGGGPNSLVMTNMQVNPGGGTTECMVKWGGFTGSGGQTDIFRFVSSHFELQPSTGSPIKRGIFCSDSTVPYIARLQTNDSSFQFDLAGGGGTFDLDPATELRNMSLDNSYFGADSTTLVLPAGGIAAYASSINNSYLNGAMHLTGNASRSFSINNSIMGTTTIDGSWSRFNAVGNLFTSWNDTAAHGTLAVTNANAISWTPQVQFGGVNSTRTYSNSGSTQRTPNGGFIASFNITATGGTETSTGTMTIAGVPYTCGANFTASPPFAQGGFGAGTAPATLLFNTSSPAGIRVFKPGSGGFALMTDTDVVLSNYSIAGTVTCGTAS